ncbi:MAG: 30S ribosomal protein S9 [candidate division WS1 bacterium]|nr:30S ribosomal protein S9 [candidate division WS1 bacterium]
MKEADKLADAVRFYGTGKRKDAVARVWLQPGTGVITINGKPAQEYLHRITLTEMVEQPLRVTQTREQLDVVADCSGGGIVGQAGAVRHGIAKALVTMNAELRGILGPAGLLTRDPRVKERKHAGRRRARRGKQFSKR